ncbi:unnamed protein product [Pedinophyceae sp. YPF-701]|nr:unnamed protein product [Pedinophyceae sp. YPF-701]
MFCRSKVKPKSKTEPSKSYKPSPVYSAEWTDEEQRILEDACNEYPVEKHQPLERYILIASRLSDKSVRDVALRVRWMQRRDTGTRKRAPERGPAGSGKPRREARQSIFAVQAPETDLEQLNNENARAGALGQAVSPTMPYLPTLDGSFDHKSEISGPVAQRLSENTSLLRSALEEISRKNRHAALPLLAAARENIAALLAMSTERIGDQQLPSLPVKVHEDLSRELVPEVATDTRTAAFGGVGRVPLGAIHSAGARPGVDHPGHAAAGVAPGSMGGGSAQELLLGGQGGAGGLGYGYGTGGIASSAGFNAWAPGMDPAAGAGAAR